MGHQDRMVTELKGKWTLPRDGCGEVLLSLWGEGKCVWMLGKAWCYCSHLVTYIPYRHVTPKRVAHRGQDGLELCSHSILLFVCLPLLRMWECHRLISQTSLKQNSGSHLASHDVLAWFQVCLWVLLLLLASMAQEPLRASFPGIHRCQWVVTSLVGVKEGHLSCWCTFHEGTMALGLAVATETS